jgi:hypothetical protein
LNALTDQFMFSSQHYVMSCSGEKSQLKSFFYMYSALALQTDTLLSPNSSKNGFSLF